MTPPVGSAWVLPKNSPLLFQLDKNIYRQFEMGLSGIHLELYIKHMAHKSRELAQASNDSKDLFEMNTKFRRETILEKPLEFANLYAGFLILFFGSGISLCFLLFELWRHKPEEQNPNVAVKKLRRARFLHGVHLFRRGTQKKRVRFEHSHRML